MKFMRKHLEMAVVMKFEPSVLSHQILLIINSVAAGTDGFLKSMICTSEPSEVRFEILYS